MPCSIAGFGTTVLGYDVMQNPEDLSYRVEYKSLDEMWKRADIVSLHCSLFHSTKHPISAESVTKLKDSAVLIYTSHNGLVTLVGGLKSSNIDSVDLDVFVGEYFYSDRSGAIIGDEMLTGLLLFPNVLATGHQTFVTKETPDSITLTTLVNVKTRRL